STRLAHVLEGIRFQVTHPVLRPLVTTSSTLNFANTGYFAVFVLWMVGPGSRVGLEPYEFSLLLAVLAVGAVLGAVIAERLVRRLSEVPLLIGCWALNCTLLLVPVLWPDALAIAGAFFVIGLTNMVGNV